MILLVYGSRGWIGSQFVSYVRENHKDIKIIEGNARVDDYDELLNETTSVNPDRIISFTGRTAGKGYETIDYLEQKGKIYENVRDNLYGPLNLFNISEIKGYHVTYLGTGCIFYGYPEKGYTEESKPDFFGSSYSVVKGFTDKLAHRYDNVLNLRIRMPIVPERHPKNFITKITTYSKICSLPNSMTVIPDFLPIIVDLIRQRAHGTVNLTNPGMITHNEILEMYREIVDPQFTWVNFTEEEQSKILASGRSNNFLNTDKIQNLYPEISPIKESIRKILYQMKNK